MAGPGPAAPASEDSPASPAAPAAPTARAAPPALEPFHYRFITVHPLPQQPTGEMIRAALQALVAAAAMTPFGPEAVQVGGARGDRWDGFQMIAESHIGLAGQGRHGEANIWSCRPFDADACADALETALGGLWYYRRVQHAGYASAAPETQERRTDGG